MSRFRVRDFGRDCWGNITGYKVLEGSGWNTVCHGTFVGNVYEPGSFEAASAAANKLCAELNEKEDA